MKYLVTGATGFIGRRLLCHLAERGDDVTVLVRDGRPVSGARSAYGDLLTGAGLVQAVQGADRVIHLAGVTKATDPHTYAEINTEGTRRLRVAIAAQPHPPHIVYCSSLAAAGPGRQRHEDDPPAPVSAYGRSKLGGELALQDGQNPIPAIIVRPPIVYGPGDHEFLPRMAVAARTGLLPVVGRRGPRRYSLIYVDDLCRALLIAADVGTIGSIYHVSDGIEHDWSDIGAAVAAALGRRPPRVVHVPAPLAMAAARTLGRSSMLNSDKIAEALHPAWTCATGRLPFTSDVSLPEGIRAALTPQAAAREEQCPRRGH